MRPVERGPCPRDESGQRRVFTEYGHARPHLTNRMGAYCSFCEMKLPAALAVEHIRHKNRNPDLEREWDNFLLACPSCNSTKGTKVDTADDVAQRLWPHLDRTFDAFVYGAGGVVRLAPMSDPTLAARAERLEQMVGLTRRPNHGLTRQQVEKASDNRWKERREAWDKAVSARTLLHEGDTDAVRKSILDTAHATGFWSVWMTVFRGDPRMQTDLCQIFRGTATDRVYPLPPHLRPPDATST